MATQDEIRVLFMEKANESEAEKRRIHDSPHGIKIGEDFVTQDGQFLVFMSASLAYEFIKFVCPNAKPVPLQVAAGTYIPNTCRDTL